MAYDYLERIDRFRTGQKMEKEHWDIINYRKMVKLGLIADADSGKS